MLCDKRGFDEWTLKYPDNVQLNVTTYGNELEQLSKYPYVFTSYLEIQTYPGSTMISVTKDKEKEIEKEINELNEYYKKTNPMYQDILRVQESFLNRDKQQEPTFIDKLKVCFNIKK
jgi:hydroxypyruvate isomerase